MPVAGWEQTPALPNLLSHMKKPRESTTQSCFAGGPWIDPDPKLNKRSDRKAKQMPREPR